MYDDITVIIMSFSLSSVQSKPELSQSYYLDLCQLYYIIMYSLNLSYGPHWMVSPTTLSSQGNFMDTLYASIYLNLYLCKRYMLFMFLIKF